MKIIIVFVARMVSAGLNLICTCYLLSLCASCSHHNVLWTLLKNIFPLASLHVQTHSVTPTVRNAKTSAPPKMIAQNVQARSPDGWTLVTAMAQGSIQRRFGPRDW